MRFRLFKFSRFESRFTVVPLPSKCIYRINKWDFNYSERLVIRPFLPRNKFFRVRESKKTALVIDYKRNFHRIFFFILFILLTQHILTVYIKTYAVDSKSYLARDLCDCNGMQIYNCISVPLDKTTSYIRSYDRGM